MKKAILHLDGDAFFAAVEIAKDHRLRGKPVVVGHDKGIATAMSYEAKRMGISRGMPVFQIKERFPQAIILPSDFEAYGSFSRRAMNIVRDHVARVEEYSIDECFAELAPHQNQGPDQIAKIGHKIKDDIQKRLGITFSVGIAETKVLAKVASKRNKPNGFTLLRPEEVSEYLDKVPIGAVWGIGPETSRVIQKYGVQTAGQFARLSLERVEELFHLPVIEIWHELNGISVFSVKTPDESDPRKSIQDTRSFRSPSSKKEFLLAELSYHAEEVCNSARRERLVGNFVSFFLKSRSGEYFRTNFTLNHHTSIPQDIVPYLFKKIDLIYTPGFIYKSSGVVLSGLIPATHEQEDLFGESRKTDSIGKIYRSVDFLTKKYGDKVVSLASSMKRNKSEYIARESLPLPYLGEVT